MLNDKERTRLVQTVCLAVVLLMEAVYFLMEDRAGGIAWYLLERYLTIPAMLFLGTALCRKQTRQTKTFLLLGAAVIVWFIVTQFVHQAMGMNKAELGTVACAYALALPYCAVAEDSQRQYGIRLTGLLVLGVAVLTVFYSGLLMLGKLPAFLKGYVSWDGARLSVMGHPNMCAALLMMGIAFCVGFALRCKKTWCKGLLAVLAALQFAVMSLTNGRTAILITCVLLGGIVFCALRRPGWKRLALALAAGIAVMAVLFGVSQLIFRSNEAYRTELALQAQQSDNPDAGAPRLDANGKLVTGSGQGTLRENMGTLNGRTNIWKAILNQIRQDPQLRAVGTEYVDLLIERGGYQVAHTHNSWLEVLCRRGTVGLILALVLTGIAVWDAAVLLWYNADLWKSCIAILELAILACAMLEPYLFADAVSYYIYDFVFMLCLGYLDQWRRQGPCQGGERKHV